MSVTNLLSLAEGIKALGEDADIDPEVENATQDIERLIESVTSAIERQRGPYVRRSVTALVEPGPFLRVLSVPMVSVQTINGAVPSGIRFGADTGLIESLTSAFEAGVDGWVTVAYTAGRCASTATVPANVKDAAALTLADLWRRTKSAHQIGGGLEGDTSRFLIPLAAIQLLGSRKPLIF